MARTSAGSPKARTLGAELRRHREAANRSERYLAEKLGINRSRIQRWQRGITVPSSEEVAIFLNALGVAEEERQRLSQVAKEVDDDNWLVSDHTGLRSELTTLIECERTCSEIVTVSPLMIPGLLQIGDYITTVMTGTDDMDRHIGVRMRRQQVLTGKNSPHLTSYISESVLRTPIGGYDVMTAQLKHLQTMAAKPHITMRVIRSHSHTVLPSHAGPWVLFKYTHAPAIVHLESFASSGFVYGVGAVAAYERAEDSLRDAALGVDDSMALIAEIEKETERRC